MWATLTAWLTKKIFTGSLNSGFIIIILATLAMLIIPNLDNISEKLGFETKATLRDKIVKEQINKDKAIAANQTLIEANKIFEKTIENTQVAINNVSEEKQKIDTKTDNIINKRKNKIENMKKKPKSTTPNTEPKTTIEPELKLAMELSGESLERVEASKVNSLAIWEAYCEFNKTEVCKDTTFSGG